MAATDIEAAKPSVAGSEPPKRADLGRVVRHGHLPEREVMTGIGPVGVRQPRVRDCGAADDAGRIRFTPAILPPYARRSRSLEVLVPPRMGILHVIIRCIAISSGSDALCD